MGAQAKLKYHYFEHCFSQCMKKDHAYVMFGVLFGITGSACVAYVIRELTTEHHPGPEALVFTVVPRVDGES